MSRKDEILDALHFEPLTIVELVERFGLTRGAINLHIKELEAADLIERVSSDHQGKVGKPPALYRARAGLEDRRSQAYPVVAPTVIESLTEKMGTAARKKLYHLIGKKLATHIDETCDTSLEARLAAARKIADSLGASTHIEELPDAIIVRSYTCPIASMVRQDSDCCLIIQEYFANATGHTCVQECHLGERVVCQYRIFRDES
jgi:predicted ArsR family transcriptional regulator